MVRLASKSIISCTVAVPRTMKFRPMGGSGTVCVCVCAYVFVYVRACLCVSVCVCVFV